MLFPEFRFEKGEFRIVIGTTNEGSDLDSYRSTYSAQVDSHLQSDSYANFKNDQFGIDSY